MTLINQLNSERERQVMSIAELARRLGWDQCTLRFKLCGQRMTSSDELVEIAGAMGLSVELRRGRRRLDI